MLDLKLLALVTLTTFGTGDQQPAVAEINGEAVSAAELQHWMLRKRAAVAGYFYRRHGVRDNADFWHRSYAGESPSAMLREKALKALTRHKVQLILARQHGLVEDIDHASWMRQMEEENAHRRALIEAGGIVRGAASFTPQSYTDYRFDRIVQNLKAELSRSDFLLDETALRTLYRNKGGEAPAGGEDRFEHFKGSLQMQFVDQRYRERVDRTTADARVTIFPPHFHSVHLP